MAITTATAAATATGLHRWRIRSLRGVRAVKATSRVRAMRAPVPARDCVKSLGRCGSSETSAHEHRAVM
ncbi:hypothetical protein ADK60_05845 [Streptomyces sp. XY431]|nr:hypothetical protein ADK60_05845 [Streptomyces sp. XY431]